MEEKIAFDVQGLLDWMAYQEDFRGSGKDDKAGHWDSLKENLAQTQGIEEPKIELFKYKVDETEKEQEGA